MHAPPPPQPHFSSGKTPIAKRTRSSHRSANDDHHNNPPPPSSTNNLAAAPPAQQIMRNAADDAIAKRRAELRRLQQQRGRSAGLAERLSQVGSRGSGVPMSMNGVNRNHDSGAVQMTARRLDESYTQHDNHAVTPINGPPPPMAVKRTSEIFPPTKRSSGSGSAAQQHAAPPPTTTTTNTMTFNNNMSMGSTFNHHYQQPPPPQQTTAPPIIPPSSTNNHSSPPLHPIQPITSSTTKHNHLTKSPFGQARVAKVVPALSLNNGKDGGVLRVGGVRSLVPPLNMLDVPPLVSEDETKVKSVKSAVGGGGSGGGGAPPSAKLSNKPGGVVKKMAPMKGVGAKNDTSKLTASSSATTTTTKTPRQTDNEKEGEMINSGQSTPIHTNRMEGSPLNPSPAAGGDEGGDVVGEKKDNGENKVAVDVRPDVSATLQQAKVALHEQKSVGQAHSTTTAVISTDIDSSSKENEKENHQQPSPSATKQEKMHETNDSTDGKDKNNISRLKLDLERSEKEKLEALEELANLKLLLEAGGVGNNNHNGETPRSLDQMSTIDTPRRGITTPRNGSDFSSSGGITTPRGGNTPSRFTPNRSTNRVGVPPLAWGTPRSTSRAGSRNVSPEHGGHSYGHPMMMSGTPRVRASPLPKQLNRAVSDSQLNRQLEEDGSSSTSTTAPPQQERVEEEFLRAAARSIPNEYGTPLASYFVRRPHVTDDCLEKNETDELAKVAIDLWENKCTHLSSSEGYRRDASVFNPNSLEIVACIEADGSVFTLSGECNARHGKVVSTEDEDDEAADNDYDWSVFDNVEEMDRALGRVSYIDMEGNEREYWLDSIYEEALSTREAYCTSLISAAFALKEVRGPLEQKREQPAAWKNETMQSQPVPMQSFAPSNATIDGNAKMSNQPLKPQAVPQSNANALQTQSQRIEPVSNVEMPANPIKNEPSKPETATKTASSKIETNQKQSASPEDYEPSDSALTVMVIALFSVFFKLTWMVVKTPFRIGSMILTFWMMLIAFRVLCLFLADDNGAWDIGAGVEYEYNMPGIY